VYAFNDWSLLEAPPRHTLEKKRWRGARETFGALYGVVDGPIRADRTGLGSFRGRSFRGSRYTVLAVVIPRDQRQVELRPKVPVYFGITPANCRSLEAEWAEENRAGSYA
jgi:hypothetical protein